MTHVIAFVDRIQQIIIAHFLHIVRHCDGVLQLQQNRFHEDQRGGEKIDQMAVQVRSVRQKQLDSEE